MDFSSLTKCSVNAKINLSYKNVLKGIVSKQVYHTTYTNSLKLLGKEILSKFYQWQ